MGLRNRPVSSSRGPEVPRFALLLTAAAPVLWSTGGVCIRITDLTSWTILFYRSLLMFITISIWIILKHRRGYEEGGIAAGLKRSFPVSICICLSLCFYVLSMKKTTIADSLLIQGTAPLFIIIGGRIFLKDTINRRTMIIIVGIFTGFMIIFVPALSSSKLGGNIFGLLKAIAFGTGAILIRRFKDVNKLPATALAAAMACIISAFLADNFKISSRDAAVLVYFGIIQTGIAFILFTDFSCYISAPVTGVLVLLESVLGPLWVWLIFNETPPRTTIIGGLIIVSLLIYKSLEASSGVK